MKNRLARVFAPSNGRAVMLAIDHGYFQGPTTGLKPIDLSIVPLLPSYDAPVLHGAPISSCNPLPVDNI
jgi:putative autoinducer-2 (AI-2) aldolase